MTLRKLLIANRGEIAIRVAQTASEMGIETVAIYSGDDETSLHRQLCDHAVALPSDGPRAYLDGAEIIRIAQAEGCDAIHPGYGFLSENAGFAADVAAAGLIFVGPEAATIELLGDKVSAKRLAEAENVPIIGGVEGPASLEELTAFFHSLPEGTAMMIKAVAGGGGRGMRVLRRAEDIPAAYASAAAEALQAFGSPDLYAERVIENARHVEIQILGDGTGAALHLGERECTLQRRHQKIVEIAPSPSISPDLRAALCEAALRMAQAVGYRGLGTFEFLLEGPEQTPFFIEANPRLQVEHTITEELFGTDLVRLQLEVAGGRTLADLGLTQARFAATEGYAMQCRITMEELHADGSASPSSGTIRLYEPPSGPGLRIDGFGRAGYAVNTSFDPLLAKLVLRSREPDFSALADKAARALARFAIRGIRTSIPFLRALLADEDVRANRVTTDFVAAHLPALLAVLPEDEVLPETEAAPAPTETEVPEGQVGVTAPIQGVLFSLLVEPGETVVQGQPIAVLEAMKMEHIVTATCGGEIAALPAQLGRSLPLGTLIATILPDGTAAAILETEEEIDLDAIRPELQEMRELTAWGHDHMRPEAVARRHAKGKNTARENLALLCDPENFEEYGALTFAAQTRRRSRQDLIENTLGDGVITGFGNVNAGLFEPEATRCALAIYDFMVLAGTQGQRSHEKQDRLFELAEKWDLPVILFGEGGGGRPGDTDHNMIAGLNVRTFATFARLANKVPVIGVVSGPCFAGNAALMGCCNVIIGTEDMHMGMAGPAMIEGGGLGRFRPEEIGPIDVQTRNGVVDIRVADETEGAEVAKKYLSYLQGPLQEWSAPDQRRLRAVIPPNRKQVYNIHNVIEALVDEGSILELRARYGIGIVTALVRIEGKPFGLMANNVAHEGGAIDSEAALKASRFMAQCDRAGLPIISLCDTPGFLVGPEVEKTGQVRNVCQMFLTGSQLSVPVLGVVLRKGYGLGAMSMVGGGFHETGFTIAWPTGEFGGMGPEGAVRLGHRKELEAIADPAEQQALFETLLAGLYESGKATSMAAGLEIDAVIDPAETRRWVLNSVRGLERGGKAVRAG